MVDLQQENPVWSSRDVDNIDLDAVSPVLPVLLLDKLRKVGAHTLQDVRNLTLGDLERARHVGSRIRKDFHALKEKIEHDPQELILCYRASLLAPSSLSPELQDCRLDHLEVSLMPGRLLKRLGELGCVTVGDALKIGTEEVAAGEGLGQLTVKSLLVFRQNLLTRPDSVLAGTAVGRGSALRKPPREVIVIPSVYQGDPLTDLKALVMAYLDILGGDLHRDILVWRNGLRGGRRGTLNDLGKNYNVSRERVRQVESRILEQLGDLFEGKVLAKESCQTDKRLVEWIGRFQASLNTRPLWDDDDLQGLLRKNGINGDHKSGNAPWANLILRVLGSKRRVFRDKIYWLVGKGMRGVVFEQVIDGILHILKSSGEAVPQFELMSAMGEKVPRADREMILLALSFLPSIIAEKRGGGLFYRFHALPAGAMARYAQLVLKEEKQAMEVDHLWKEIRTRFGIKGWESHTSLETLQAQLALNACFAPVPGKGCLWGLKDWGLKAESLAELVVGSLKKQNRPMSLRELTEAVAKSRPGIRLQTIRGVLHRSRADVLSTHDGRFMLAEWQERYPGMVSPNSFSPYVSAETLCQMLEEIYGQSGKSSLTLRELMEGLRERQVDWTYNHSHRRLCAMSCLRMETVDGLLHFFYTPVQGEEEGAKSSSGENSR